jgi:hypothetical protein
VSHRESVGLACVVECDQRWEPRARYVLDVFARALGIRLCVTQASDSVRPLLVYSSDLAKWESERDVVAIRHDASAWFSSGAERVATARRIAVRGNDGRVLALDLLALAFYFISSSGESEAASSRKLYRDSIFQRHGVPMDIVDLCVDAFRRLLSIVGAVGSDDERLQRDHWEGKTYAVALTHDVDYLPVYRWDNLKVAIKSVARHLVKQRSPLEAVEAMAAYLKTIMRSEDPYGCVPAIVAEEQRRGVKSSFQVAVGHRHAFDVNYRIEDDRIRDYLMVILEQGFDLCLHGSYRSTEQPGWYEEEVNLLAQRLGRPSGSRQHFLSFDADALFAAQERAGIEYDMSMGFPDRCGSRVGFSHPYFPYCVEAERRYDVVQIPLVLMDVTLRSYMGLRGDMAWAEIERQLEVVRKARGAVSVVWHPIVFTGARDPGFDRLYWRLVEYVQGTGGLATDGRTINALARERAARFGLFPRLPADAEVL